MGVWSDFLDSSVIRLTPLIPLAELLQFAYTTRIMPCRILSLNGGGIRGLCQAVYLFEAAKKLPSPLRSNFELIAGTSTGALIALGVALEIHPQMLVDLFRKNGGRIFGHKKLASGIRKGSK